MSLILTNIHDKHLTIDRIGNQMKFSLLKGYSFHFSINCQCNEKCVRLIYQLEYLNLIRIQSQHLPTINTNMPNYYKRLRLLEALKSSRLTRSTRKLN